VVAQNDDDTRAHLGDALHGLAQRPGTAGIAQPDDIRQGIDGMHADQRRLRGVQLAPHQRQVHVLVDMILVR
jgi:hypothetical protein